MKVSNLKWQAFVNEYLTNGRNAGEAYISVYKPKSKRGAHSSAKKLLEKPEILLMITAYDEEQKKNKQISKDKYLKILDKIAEEDPDTRIRIEAIKTIGKWQGYESEVKLSVLSINDVLKAQESEETIDLD